MRTNEKIYDLLVPRQEPAADDPRRYQELSRSATSTGTSRANNVFHVTEEFAVERTGSHETRRPDIVLFVNGIPLCVIECKRPDLKDPIEQAVSQQIRNQREDEIPRLILLLPARCWPSRRTRPSTRQPPPPAKFWSVWKEGRDVDAELVPRWSTTRSPPRQGTGSSQRPFP